MGAGMGGEREKKGKALWAGRGDGNEEWRRRGWRKGVSKEMRKGRGGGEEVRGGMKQGSEQGDRGT